MASPSLQKQRRRLLQPTCTHSQGCSCLVIAIEGGSVSHSSESPHELIPICRLMTALDDLCDRLSEDPPRLPSWIFVPVTSIPPILDAIRYWIDTAKTIRTETALQLHEIPDLRMPTPVTMGMPGPMFPSPENLTEYSQQMFRECAIAALGRMTDQELVRSGLVPNYLSASSARHYVERHKSHVVDLMVEQLKDAMPSPNADLEAKWYMMTKTIPFPKNLEARHPALKQLSNAVKKNGDIPRALITKVFPSRQCPCINVHPVDHEQAQQEVETTWKPNITLYVRVFFVTFPHRFPTKFPTV